MPSRAGRLLGQGCLIVGGTGGIGLATARRFLEEGARVVVAGRTPEERDEARRRLQGAGPGPGPVEAMAADVTQPEAVAALFDDALDVLGGRIDVLFHVAGISGRRLG